MSLEILILAIVVIQTFLVVFLLTQVQKKNSASLEQAKELMELRSQLEKQMQSNRTEIQQGLLQQFALVMESLRANAKDQSEALKDFGRLFRENVQEFNALQREKFQELVNKQERMLQSTEDRLEKMRETVDEKLQKTLEARLGQSFELVSKQLLAVQKGLGEMQTLATGVGDLKRVLSNVKSRGVMGEYQLQGILENVLSPEQYAYNVAVKTGQTERVEYAIKMPGNHEDGPVYLPIDAKFPQETYYRLLDAYDTGDKTLVEAARQDLFKAIKKAAQDISQKYIHPPYTTDFGLLFLPMESLYAEVIRDAHLAQSLQRDFKIVVTGPTTLAAMLNSLQMGFRTLAIQQRSSEVWKVLGAVKTEFSKFGDLISKAQKKISEANNDLDLLVGTRTRMIQRKLKEVEELPEEEGRKLLE
ncbi:DNA recombination protein RmuC [Cecembia calidifontis]|jgi:DNA recombination protein RmuC|uniref:DNA recombination protein RmuC n=1 Tax=Cecembia calidifontis TaxID=1187080 RepID=A0A4Q7PB03_9BACT|nr:DNA recombination protein RmuC [Cecembia calidifontis]RZS97411.1 DNA recombination protein RmuC [Cecembia calidifontis]